MQNRRGGGLEDYLEAVEGLDSADSGGHRASDLDLQMLIDNNPVNFFSHCFGSKFEFFVSPVAKGNQGQSPEGGQVAVLAMY